jgi:hypothetical protein
MKPDQPITQEYFTKRLAELCLRSGLAEFPKDEVDVHILLKSAALGFDPARVYTEKEVNEKLESWLNNVCPMKFIDRVMLRRRLVDTGYLDRAKDGSTYQFRPGRTKPPFFDPAVDEVDPETVIDTAREEIARRKREYMEKHK